MRPCRLPRGSHPARPGRGGDRQRRGGLDGGGAPVQGRQEGRSPGAARPGRGLHTHLSQQGLWVRRGWVFVELPIHLGEFILLKENKKNKINTIKRCGETLMMSKPVFEIKKQLFVTCHEFINSTWRLLFTTQGSSSYPFHGPPQISCLKASCCVTWLLLNLPAVH